MLKDQSQIVIGNSNFVNTCPQFLQQQREIIDRDQWQSYDQCYFEQPWKQIFSLMLSSTTFILRLFCTHSGIIKQIHHIQFPHLKILSLGDSNIFSLQPIIKLHTPHLQHLQFEMNHISQIKCLRKCSFPQLRILSMTQNYFNDLLPLSEAHFPKLLSISIQYLNLSIMGESLNWILKLQTAELKRIRRLESVRIKQQKLQTQLQKKYNDILITQ